MSALCPHYMQENTMKNTFNTVNNCGTSAVYRAASLIREAGAGGSNPLFPTNITPWETKGFFVFTFFFKKVGARTVPNLCPHFFQANFIEIRNGYLAECVFFN